MMSTQLNGKRVVVLGGSAGIGLATAQAAAAEGALVVIVSRNQQRITAALATLPATAIGVSVDLTDEVAISRFFSGNGSFDYLVYTAGDKLLLGPVANIPLAEVEKAFRLRFMGAYNAVRYAYPHLQPGGAIVLTSGIAGVRPQPGWSAGASICGAMESLTRALAVELAPIRVNIVSPGFVRTDLWADIPEAERAAMYEQVGNNLPVKRVGEAEDIARTYLYLMKAGFSTGQTVIVDGGAALV